jgi:predicted dehydrogenase
MAKKVSILIIGIGGHGNVYVNELLNNMESKRFSIVGAVDPYPEGCRRLDELKKLKVPFFKTIEGFYKNNSADLALISTPIQHHAFQSCYAMNHGSNVLCEKPACATIQDALKMAETRDKTGKFLAIGYQLAFSESLLKLKRDIMSGKLGKPKRLKTIMLAPRNKDYYSRKWAAKIKDEFGNWVLDSVVSNATAHYINNMFFVLGKEEDESIYPSEVQAELYRANDIENFDTVAAKISTKEGIEIMFYASHATDDKGSFMHYEFENATVTYLEKEDGGNSIIAQFNSGETIDYSDYFENQTRKLWVCVDAAAGLDANITCKIETATPHVISVNGMQDSVPEIVNFPPSLIKTKGDPEYVWVEGLREVLLDCYNDWVLPSDKNIPWAKLGKKINLVDYKHFSK